MAVLVPSIFRIKQATAAEIAAATPQAGRIIHLTDEQALVVGDGVNVGADLPRAGGAFEEVAGVVRQRVPGYDEDFVFGSPQLDDDETAGHDMRMLFDKSKGAFRAGWVAGAEWDEANRGIGSAAFGGGTASGTYSHAEGTGVASGIGAHAEGTGTLAATGGSHAGGTQSVTTRVGESVHSTGKFALAGDFQSAEMEIFKTSTHTTTAWLNLVCGGGIGDFYKILMGDYRVMSFEADVIGTNQGCGDVWHYTITGLIKNVAGTPTLPYAPTVTTLFEADADFEIQAIVEDFAEESDSALLIQVRDASGNYAGGTVRWGATVRLTELSFPA